MRVTKQLVNLLGFGAIVIVLAAALGLGAYPIYSGAQAVDAERRDVVLNNDAIAAQVAQLQTYEAQLPALKDELADMQTQIPAVAQIDEISALLVQAASDSKGSIKQFTPNTQEPFLATLTPGAEAQGGSTGGSATGAGREQQVPLSIVVEFEKAADSSSFLDALRQGPRVLRIVSTQLSQPGAATQLTVSALAFVHTEG